MDLILARHGNTFNKGDRVVWIGHNEDLPLTKDGEEQARQLGRAIAKLAPLTAAYTSQLKRAKDFARIALEEAGISLTPIVDERLSELDYGIWGGLTSDEIRERYGAQDLESWEKKSIWPPEGVWGSQEQQVIKDIESLASQLLELEGRVLVVSSSGTLRYFLKMVPGEFERRAGEGLVKLRTGSIGHMRLGDERRVILWNESPSALVSQAEG